MAANICIKRQTMRTVGASEARARFSQLLDAVARGETIAITKRGVPVARLVLHGLPQHVDVRSVIEAMRTSRRGGALGEVSIRELIDDGRRFSSL